MSADRSTVFALAVRHLAVRRGRGAILLFGFAMGTAVMMVLLSVGRAMVLQSRDVALVGGGEVTVLPEGIDLEGLRTGSMGGLFFGIERARFLHRVMLGGPRLAAEVRAVSPVLERRLVYLVRPGELLPLRAGGELPDAARAVDAGLDLLEGAWEPAEGDRRWAAPTPEELYHELDRWHTPLADSSWAEWHYFNILLEDSETWYLTYLVGWGGGRLLVTRHRPNRPPERFLSLVGSAEIRTDTASADLILGPHSVSQRGGRYRLIGRSGPVAFDLVVRPTPNAYFPPVELASGAFRSGYVVPAVRGTATGTICQGGSCRRFENVAGYHDHNWGVWRETTWNWGQARGAGLSVVYGGVVTDSTVARLSGRNPYFMAVVDSLGIRQVLRFGRVDYRGGRPIAEGVSAPEAFSITATRDRDTVHLDAVVRSAVATTMPTASGVFLQLRGRFMLSGTLLGSAVTDSGLGAFETFVKANVAR